MRQDNGKAKRQGREHADHERVDVVQGKRQEKAVVILDEIGLSYRVELEDQILVAERHTFRRACGAGRIEQHGRVIWLDLGQLAGLVGDRVVVGVSKTGRGPGSAITGTSATVVSLTFRVHVKGKTLVSFAGPPSDAPGRERSPG